MQEHLTDEEIQEFLPKLEQLRGTLDKRRAKCIPKLPANPSQIDFFLNDVTKKFAMTVCGKPFLQYDNKSADNRILLFVSERGVNHLSESDRWHADGTFKEAPDQFYQLYILHGYNNGLIFPCAYVALMNKRTETYNEMLDALKKIGLRAGVEMSPKSALIDFELAVKNSFTFSFPKIKIKGLNN